ncbi:Ubiquitin-like modifier-activating enzyme ATG7 [Tribolium castaneum]|uniref:Ubiquitin-like modifier-activating enzyme ATG7 n=1 Tax=Tribolium castaneum TaxID=7070 RepID=A0A139WBZ1_TRICA|nr:PREDICTED: ubiquitin-like modifier-activating enzyme ATG7 [Tribolium castaneum]KYB25457.1 Ubiquitin-like modifier-activating enzyme ATG7 [Tribolium castaneum]|eukprot:XP_008199635.1 PREDICTED: ubiquitin-like modifier-activating enzyme ATG7 [Tribolium castaneum]
MSSTKPLLQLVTVSSFVQPSFWNKLSELKINVDKLNDDERQIYGFFSNSPTTWTTHIVEVDSTSFNTTLNSQNNIPFQGKIFNKNTIEQFKDCDKTKMINEEGRRFLEELKSGKVLEKPYLMNFFFILSFSDLKKFHFYYWFAYPVPHNLEISVEGISPISEHFTEAEVASLSTEYTRLDPHQKPYFLIHNKKLHTYHSKLSQVSENNCQEYYFAFADYINSGQHPKSQIKNYIIFLLHHCPFLGGKTLNFLLFFLDRKLSCCQSLIYKLTLPQCNSTIDDIIYGGGDNAWAGWEKNEKNKFAPRFSNMRTTMDPQILFEESVDLNLKLMKWRLLPDINLDKIKNAKCLLLGAGTLGCSVARNLLGWGVRNINFVDNSTVSYSNPVRQHLFTYEDAVKSKPKAEAAAESLHKIFPSINSQGHQFTIPMPGHNVGESTVESVKKSVEDLEKLIQEHDIVFLLTDSRESRWLPTLLGIFHNKIVINVALGFDTYLIMRYGRKDIEDNVKEVQTHSAFKRISGNELGCYFCNDVTAPGNSLKDRTLDQQCTVTRPGVSSIAGALSVELTVSLLQHEEGINAPAFYKTGPQHEMNFTDDQGGVLGILPHSIRGFLSSFMHVLPATPKYNQCIACSSIVLEEYKAKGFAFLLETFNSNNYLENLTGLSKLFADSNYADVLELSDEEWEN